MNKYKLGYKELYHKNNFDSAYIGEQIARWFTQVYKYFFGGLAMILILFAFNYLLASFQ